jgi:hypothetical protein
MAVKAVLAAKEETSVELEMVSEAVTVVEAAANTAVQTKMAAVCAMMVVNDASAGEDEAANHSLAGTGADAQQADAVDCKVQEPDFKALDTDVKV